MALRRVEAFDLVELPTERTLTPEGYLEAPGKLARTGIQLYTAKELGLDAEMGIDAARMMRIYRPAEEVSARASLDSFAGKPVTLGHPTNGRIVNAKTWKDLAVGDVHNVAMDGSHMTGRLIIRDAAAVAAVVKGKRQISNGYSFDLDMTPGTTPDGQSYDGVQRNIHGNHTAIVDMARGGHTCRIADAAYTDENEETTTMAMTKIALGDGIEASIEEAHVPLFRHALAQSAAGLKTAQDAVAAETARAVKAETDLVTAKKTAADAAAEIVTLKAQIPTPEAYEAAAEERATVVGDAAVMAPDLKPKGLSVSQIRIAGLDAALKDERLKPFVVAVLKDVAPAKAGAVELRCAFDSVAAAARSTTATDGFATDADDTYRREVADAMTGSGTGGRAPAGLLVGRAKMVNRLFQPTSAKRGPVDGGSARAETE